MKKLRSKRQRWLLAGDRSTRRTHNLCGQLQKSACPFLFCFVLFYSNDKSRVYLEKYKHFRNKTRQNGLTMVNILGPSPPQCYLCIWQCIFLKIRWNSSLSFIYLIRHYNWMLNNNHKKELVLHQASQNLQGIKKWFAWSGGKFSIIVQSLYHKINHI